MKYTDFVKSHYDKVKHLPAKDRMKKIAELWRKSGLSKTKKQVAGKGIGTMLGGLADDVLGLGMHKKRAGRPKKDVHEKQHKRVAGKGLGSMIGSIADEVFGLGMSKPHHNKKMSKHELNELLSNHLVKAMGHTNSKITKKDKMDLLHKLQTHGGGFWDFDKAFDGIKTGFNAVVNPAISAAQTIIPLVKLLK